MRSVSFGVVLLAILANGCASISGLGDYQEGPSGGSEAAISGSDASTGGVDSSPGEDVWVDDGGADGLDDGSQIVDVVIPADVDLDAPQCGPTVSCASQHCCSNGQCVGGLSVNTCGTGGACKDCTSIGGACTNGACTTPVVDAAPAPTCNAKNCGGCTPFVDKGCCKSDMTCGCTSIWTSGPCN
jgi:hypothetical protein